MAINSGLSFLDSEVSHQHDILEREVTTNSAIELTRPPELAVSIATAKIEVKVTTFLIFTQ